MTEFQSTVLSFSIKTNKKNHPKTHQTNKQNPNKTKKPTANQPSAGSLF